MKVKKYTNQSISNKRFFKPHRKCSIYNIKIKGIIYGHNK